MYDKIIQYYRAINLRDEINIDNIIKEPLSRELQVVTLHLQEVQSSSLVQGLQSNPVLQIDLGFTQGYNGLRLTIIRKI